MAKTTEICKNKKYININIYVCMYTHICIERSYKIQQMLTIKILPLFTKYKNKIKQKLTKFFLLLLCCIVLYNAITSLILTHLCMYVCMFVVWFQYCSTTMSVTSVVPMNIVTTTTAATMLDKQRFRELFVKGSLYLISALLQ